MKRVRITPRQFEYKPRKRDWVYRTPEERKRRRAARAALKEPTDAIASGLFDKITQAKKAREKAELAERQAWARLNEYLAKSNTKSRERVRL